VAIAAALSDLALGSTASPAAPVIKFAGRPTGS
jgi:hypothetical protein